MAEKRQTQGTTDSPPPFRLDVQLHELLMQPAAKSAVPASAPGELQKLPEPVFPNRPELQNGADEDYMNLNGNRHWTGPQIMHTLHGWALPYLKSRMLPGDFHPIIAYLFTEWKCNLD